MTSSSVCLIAIEEINLLLSGQTSMTLLGELNARSTGSRGQSVTVLPSPQPTSWLQAATNAVARSIQRASAAIGSTGQRTWSSTTPTTTTTAPDSRMITTIGNRSSYRPPRYKNRHRNNESRNNDYNHKSQNQSYDYRNNSSENRNHNHANRIYNSEQRYSENRNYNSANRFHNSGNRNNSSETKNSAGKNYNRSGNLGSRGPLDPQFFGTPRFKESCQHADRFLEQTLMFFFLATTFDLFLTRERTKEDSNTRTTSKK